MCEILIFGGTTEGRLLAEFCEKKSISAIVSVVSDYGKELVKESGCVRVSAVPMDETGMEDFLRGHNIGLAVDSTHPYARQATENIRRACEAVNVRRIRCLRGESGPDRKEPGEKRSEDEKSGSENVVRVSSAEEAVSFLEGKSGNVLVTTGSKELAAFTALAGFKDRVYVRILPSPEALQNAAGLGFEKRRLIAMQGPFTEEMNAALIRQVRAEYLVTKETGKAGGFSEKMNAAASCGITAVVVSRPREPEGVSLEEACAAMEKFWKRVHKKDGKEPFLSLVGIGPGDVCQMTGAAVSAVRESSVLFGSPRALLAVRPLLTGGQTLVEKYLAKDVVKWLKDRKEELPDKAAVLFSGDSGFYSGAKKMAAHLREENIPFKVIPGVSSAAYLAAKLGVSWEDAFFCTAHGRDFNIVSALRSGKKKIFLLLSGENSVRKECRALCGGGFSSARVSVGENLSYPEERITTGAAEELLEAETGALCLMLVEVI